MWAQKRLSGLQRNIVKREGREGRRREEEGRGGEPRRRVDIDELPLKEIVRQIATAVRRLLLRGRAWGRVKLKESIFEMFVDLHDRALIAAPVTVVRSTEDGNYIFLMTPVVTLHYELMGPRNKRQAIIVIELF